MLPDKKIIAFDVDGTLTESKSPITDSMASLLKELIKQKMVIAVSGGKFGQFETQFLPPFEKDNSFIPFIHNLKLLTTSGTQRYDFDEAKHGWMLIDKEPLGEEVKERIKKLLKEIIESSAIYEIPPNPTGDIVEDRDTQITFSALGQQAKVEDKKAWDPDQRKRKKIVSVIGPQVPEVTMLINAYSSIDIVPKGFNKAVGLTRYLDKIGLNKSDIVYVGDALFPGGNDYSIVEAGIENIAVKGPEETEVIIRTWLKN
jgi:hypothetical protein